MRRISILVSTRAAKEIDDAARWWADRGSPTRIDDAIAEVLAHLEELPEMAPRIQIRGRWSTTRRASVDPVGYNLFYRYDARASTILVQCFRHQHRRPPRL